MTLYHEVPFWTVFQEAGRSICRATHQNRQHSSFHLSFVPSCHVYISASSDSFQSILPQLILFHLMLPCGMLSDPGWLLQLIFTRFLAAWSSLSSTASKSAINTTLLWHLFWLYNFLILHQSSLVSKGGFQPFINNIRVSWPDIWLKIWRFMLATRYGNSARLFCDFLLSWYKQAQGACRVRQGIKRFCFDVSRRM